MVYKKPPLLHLLVIIISSDLYVFIHRNPTKYVASKKNVLLFITFTSCLFFLFNLCIEIYLSLSGLRQFYTGIANE